MSLPTAAALVDRKSTRLNSSHANISPLSLPDALAIPRSTTCPTLLVAALASPSGPAGSSTCHEPAHRRRARHLRQGARRQGQGVRRAEHQRQAATRPRLLGLRWLRPWRPADAGPLALAVEARR